MTDTYRVIRATSVAAEPAAVFEHLNDFHKWQAWSPWEDLDPQQRRNYSGAESGVGAKYVWHGNRKVGQGSMEITESQSPNKVVVDLRFIKPFKSSAVTSFDVQPSESGSTVTWTMEGPKTFMTKMMGVLKSMDAMIGPDFEKGLARLKSTVESS